MRKLLAISAALILCLSLSACGGDNDSSDTSAAKGKSESAAESAAEDSKNDSSSVLLGENAKEYHITGYGTVDGVYSLDLAQGDNYSEFVTINVDDKELGSALGRFSENYTIKTDASGGKLGAYDLIDKDGISLGQLDAEEIRQHFDKLLKYDSVEWSYDGEVRLSELDEGIVYKAPVSESGAPIFINDTDKDLVVWLSNDVDNNEYAYPYPLRGIDGLNRPDFNIYATGSNIFVRIERIDADKLKTISDSVETVFADTLSSGQSKSVGNAAVIANAGETDIKISIVTYDGGVFIETIAAKTIYAIDPMQAEHIEIA